MSEIIDPFTNKLISELQQKESMKIDVPANSPSLVMPTSEIAKLVILKRHERKEWAKNMKIKLNNVVDQYVERAGRMRQQQVSQQNGSTQ